MQSETRVEWREWGPGAFEEAQAGDHPVLLSLSATWCADCHEMDAETYAEPRVAANLNDDFVPVRVDVDRHPRVRERYNMGGFPSTVFTTPSGELLAGATYLGPDGMRQVLDAVRERWTEQGAAAGRIPRALSGAETPSGPITDRIERGILGALTEQFDAEFGGWGTNTKFPLPRTVEFALTRAPDQARETLDAIEASLQDDAAGGFFRYADGRDWSDPHREKLLDANAALLRAFARGYLHTGRDSYRRAAERTVDFLVDRLWTGSGFGGSVAPANSGTDDGGPDERVDRTVYAGANALAAAALFEYHAYTDDKRARTYARRTLSYVASTLVEGGEVTHFRTDDAVGETGLLEDQARVAAALARAAQVVGRDVPDVDGDMLATAADVADVAVERLHDAAAFRDGPPSGPGLLDRPLRPIDANAEMVGALLDLAALTGSDDYRAVARGAVGAFAGAWDRLGVRVATYGSVASRIERPRLTIDVGGPAGSTLHRVALRVADHDKVVVPAADGVAEGTAEVRFGGAARTATTPDELVESVATVRDDVAADG
jgi:hypothetical protein